MLQAIMEELQQRSAFLEDIPVETIYLGGGTPSLLSADEINRIAEYIFRHYRCVDGLVKGTGADNAEFTVEANPDDLDRGYISSLKNTPVSRFSIGIQSFFDKDLQYMHRAHNAAQADYAVKAAQDAGFTNITVDLIYGTPGLSDAAWRSNLEKVKKLGIPHFSAYALTVEEGTALYHAIEKKKAVPVDPDQAAAQFEILAEQAGDMGFEQYEISNLALPGHYARHNTNYWSGIPYLGIGPSAHSFDGQNRSWNIANNALYLRHIHEDNLAAPGQRGRWREEEILTPAQQLNEYIMTSLRTMWGTDLNRVASTWGETYRETLLARSAELQKRQWMICDGKTLKLTAKGRLFADGIAGDLFF